MKKLFKVVTLALVIALATSLAACNLANKTSARRDDYKEQIASYIEDLSVYTDTDKATIEALIDEYIAKLDDVAANSKMKALVEEFKAAVGEIFTIEQLIEAYKENLNNRIQAAIDEILPVMYTIENVGISNITYDKVTHVATFYITDENAKIRTFADTGVCDIFRAGFQDVDHADITAYDTNGTELGRTENFSSDLMFGDDVNLKHNVGEYFIKLFVEDYPQATLSHLVGRSATAQVYFNCAIDDSTQTDSFSCRFVKVTEAE